MHSFRAPRHPWYLARMAQSKCSVKIVAERDAGYILEAFVVVEGVGLRALMVKLK